MISFCLNKCPFCLKENVVGTVTSFYFTDKVSSTYAHSKIFHAFGHCNHCLMGMVGNGLVRNAYSAQSEFKQYQGDIAKFEYMDGLPFEWYPKSPKIDIPTHLPKNVEDKFLQAERLSNQNDMRDPAGNAYRATLERSILHIDASLTGGNLYSKIEKLAKNGQITDDLKNFAHQIRNLGNDATHNDDDITQEELNNLRIFTRMFLMYVFTLPAMIPQTVKP